MLMLFIECSIGFTIVLSTTSAFSSNDANAYAGPAEKLSRSGPFMTLLEVGLLKSSLVSTDF